MQTTSKNDIDYSPDVKFEPTETSHRGFKLIHANVQDPYERNDPHTRKIVIREIEDHMIPGINEHIQQRGRKYKHGEDNPITEWLFGQSDVLRRWKDQVPKAEALYPLQRPGMRKLSDGTEFDSIADKYFPHVLDGIALRSRAAVMTKVMHEYFENYLKTHNLNWTSLASGAAIPVFDAATSLNHHGHTINLKLVDISGSALKFALNLAQSEYQLQDQIETIKLNILKTRLLKKQIEPNSQDAIDILGFFEYLPEKRWRYKFGITFPGATQFLATAYGFLKPGGLLVFGNMRDTHPHLTFTRGVVQWPLIRPRSVKKLMDMVENAGIDLRNVTVYLPDDNVYAVIAIKKPRSN